MGPDQYYVDYTAVLATHPAAQGARLARGCWDALQQGYTSIRDVGGLGCEVARAIEDGTIVGPNIYSSGACISQTGGHGDVHALPIGDGKPFFSELPGYVFCSESSSIRLSTP